jgi:hypothetical protein
MPNKNSTWKFELSLRKTSAYLPHASQTSRKSPQESEKPKPIHTDEKRGKIENCWTKKSPCRPLLTTGHRPLTTDHCSSPPPKQ